MRIVPSTYTIGRSLPNDVFLVEGKDVVSIRGNKIRV